VGDDAVEAVGEIGAQPSSRCFMQKGNSMRAFVLKAALLTVLVASPACAQGKPAPDDLQTVVVTSSPVAQLGTVALQPVTEVEFQYESILNVDGLLELPADNGARWPSTTWVLYLH
jgi:hypothetical protein